MATATLVRPRSRRRIRPLLLAVFIVFVALLAAVWGLAKLGVLPTEAWAANSPAAKRFLSSLGLATEHRAAVAAAPLPVVTPRPVTPSLPLRPLDDRMEMPAAAPPAPRTPRRDNAARVARILATMDAPDVARLFAGMPDAEVAPLLLKMSERTAGEILTALPTRRAVVLTRYLRRYAGSG